MERCLNLFRFNLLIETKPIGKYDSNCIEALKNQCDIDSIEQSPNYIIEFAAVKSLYNLKANEFLFKCADRKLDFYVI